MACRNHPEIKKEYGGNTGLCNECAKKEGKRLYDEQAGKCAICGDFLGPCDSTGLVPRSAHLDHNHDTGQVREVLCRPCNLALGLLDEDPSRVRKAAEYLEKWNKKATNQST